LENFRVCENELAFVLAGDHGHRVLAAFPAALGESCDVQEWIIV
jgi:hypothetical protein